MIDEDGHVRQDDVGSRFPHPRTLSVSKALEVNELIKKPEKLQKAYQLMTRVRQLDDIMMNVQRQGRISFYMSCRGEEAIHMGVASALHDKDVVLAQYREQGVLMWRGFNLNQMMSQCFSTSDDLGKGRQMPVHYGSRALNFHTISSPLGTQLPQAVGVAKRLKMENTSRALDDHRLAIAFFGDGSASTGDFHAACNMAATLEVPMIFLCRNNGYAISTSVTEQYRGDGIVSRAPGYGMAGIRVDGNDVLAVHSAIQMARDYALSHDAPVMVECMTYRQSHHSTSDDSTRYRDKEEVAQWSSKDADPLDRLLNYLKLSGEHETVDQHTKACNEERQAVLRAMEHAESRPKPDVETMFDDVYKTLTPHLMRQKEEHLKHVQRHAKFYQNAH
jgi:2-oxoisovalerate dehydrogenase E1 component alpha subunit